VDSLTGILVIFLGLCSAGFGVFRLMNTSDSIRRLKVDSEALATQANAEVIQLENAVEAMSKRVDDRKKSLKDLIEKSEEVLSLLSPEDREKRRPVYIANDRRLKGDIEFRAKVTCPRMSGGWQLGREYVLWAKDEENARRSYESKFPPSASFVVGELRRAADPL